MDPAQLEHFRQRLLAERRYWQERVAGLNAGGLRQSMGEAYGETSLYDNHPADAGTEMFEREKEVGLRWAALQRLAEVDRALVRIREGYYGLCERCGRPIPPQRLEVVPAAALCLECKQAEEAAPDPLTRPVEEQVLAPPFGRSFRDGTTYTGYDGEDAWQDVAVYGTSETPQDVPGAKEYDDLYRSAGDPMGGIEEPR